MLQAPDTEIYRITRRSLMSDPVFGLLSKAVLFTDPPAHGTLRRPMTRAMTATAAAQRDASLRTRAEALVQAFEDRGHFDLVTDFATPYIVGAIGELLRLTLTDIPALKRQTTEMARALDLRTCEARPARNVSSAPELAQWVECALDTALVSDEGLCATFLEHCDSGQWTRSDVITNMVFLLFAGQETAVDGLGNAVLAIALETLMRRLPAWRIDEGSVVERDAITFRGHTSIPVTLHTAGAGRLPVSR